MTIIVIIYAIFLIFITAEIDTKTKQSLRKGKKIVSIIHSSIIFSLVSYGIINKVDTYVNDTIIFSMIYLVVDICIHPYKRTPDLYYHHIIVFIGEVISIYIGLQEIVYGSMLGELLSVVLHIWELSNNKYIKCFFGILIVAVFIITRVFLPFMYLYILYNMERQFAMMYYSLYIFVNLYWLAIIYKKAKQYLSCKSKKHLRNERNQ